MYRYTHKQNTTKQIETHSSVSTQKKKKIDSTKLNYRVPNPKTYLSVCTNSIINTKRNTAKTTIHILVANQM